MKECDGGRRKCWAYAAERPGFSIVKVLFMYVLFSRREILAVPHISNAPHWGGHLVGSEQIWRRAPQITRWQDVRYRQEFRQKLLSSISRESFFLERSDNVIARRTRCLHGFSAFFYLTSDSLKRGVYVAFVRWWIFLRPCERVCLWIYTYFSKHQKKQCF